MDGKDAPLAHVLAAALASGVYWLAVAALSAGEFWVVCTPSMTNCPTLWDTTLSAGVVLTLGLAGFCLGVWGLRRFPAFAPPLAWFVLTGAFIAVAAFVAFNVA